MKNSQDRENYFFAENKQKSIGSYWMMIICENQIYRIKICLKLT